MTLIEEVKNAIITKKIPPIFSSNDIKDAGIVDKHHNISNYDKKNKGPQNSHTTILVSAIINGITYYTFDEQLFE